MWKANQSQTNIVTRAQLTSSPMFSFPQFAYAPCPEKYFTHLCMDAILYCCFHYHGLAWLRGEMPIRNVNNPSLAVKMKVASMKWQRWGCKQCAHLIGPLKQQSKASWESPILPAPKANHSTRFSPLCPRRTYYIITTCTRKTIPLFTIEFCLYIKKKNITDTNATHSRLKSVFLLSKYSFRCVRRIVRA